MFFYTLLPRLLNMSLAASVVIVSVLLLRLVLKKAPKCFSYALWSLVLFRLLCPVSVESSLSLFGLLNTPAVASGPAASSISYLPADIVHTEFPAVTLPIPGLGEAVSQALPRGEEQLAADPLEAPMAIATYVWLAGALAVGGWAAASYLRLCRRLVTASRLRDNLYLADGIPTPFVLGLLRPRIYLPSSLDPRELPYIVAHEQHHIRRLDHLAKALAFAALCLHWFNPLVWVAFAEAGKDMEMSCDEAVVRKLGDGVLADYAASLLRLADGRSMAAGMPLAFGEGDAGGRIRNLAHWKRPALGAMLAAAAACVLVAVCLLTNPPAQSLPFALEDLEITRAVTLDCRPGEPTSHELNASELDELASRLAEVDIGRPDDDLAGFTPLYSLSVQADGQAFSLAGFDTAGAHTALCYQETFYRIDSSAFCDYLQVLCAGGNRSAAAEVPPVQVWFDDCGRDEMDWDSSREIRLDAFPGVTFRCTPQQLEAVTEDETLSLYTGMPIWNVFFTDLTGDGLPELCSTLSMGSGIVDSRVILYDYANGISYTLEDRMVYDYSLSLEDSRLVVTKRTYPAAGESGEIVERGYLAYLDNVIRVVPLEAASKP